MLEDSAYGLCLIHLKRRYVGRHGQRVETFLIRIPHSRRGTRCGVRGTRWGARTFQGKQEARDNLMRQGNGLGSAFEHTIEQHDTFDGATGAARAMRGPIDAKLFKSTIAR